MQSAVPLLNHGDTGGNENHEPCLTGNRKD